MQSEASGSFAETTVFGERSQEWRVKAEDCPALSGLGIAHVGVAVARPPYEVVRVGLKGAYFLSCFAGAGSVLLDGRWQKVGEGMAFLASPNVLLAARADRGVSWGFSWVRFQNRPEAGQVVSEASPALARFGGQALRHAVLGLHAELAENRGPAFVSRWAQLICEYALLFAKPERGDKRLERLWASVDERLGEAWSLERMAAVCFLSEEHLRRLCRREVGRSPMNQLVFLRMRRASELLLQTEDKVEVIAHAVGYANAFVFSNTFKRWIGWRPSEYRLQRRPSKCG
jgi:AraC-like DNA-binding protein